MDVAEVIARHRGSIIGLPDVIGVAVGKSKEAADELCIRVYSTSGKWPEALPRQLDGYRVELVKKSRGFRAR